MSEYDMPLDEQVKLIAKELRVLGEAVRVLGEGMRTRFDGVDTRLDKLQVLGEETNSIAKLGLEGIQGLRESTDEKFADVSKKSGEQIALLKSTFVHVRKRVEVVEQPKTRRRR